jgi:single-strand DNA-binding protein
MSDLVAAVVRASVHRFIGRLGRDPEARYFESGSCVVNCRMAVNRAGAKRDDGQEADWFKLEIRGETGQAFADGCVKGDLVDVIGRIKSQQWQDRTTGEMRSQLVIMAEEWRIVPTDRPPAQQCQQAAPAALPTTPPPAMAPAPYPDDEPPF